jgi:hypothetical protein
MTKFKDNLAVSRELQALMHKYGSEVFTDGLFCAYHNAADETEDLENKSLTQKYRYLANGVGNLIDDEPEFSRNEIENEAYE